MGLGRNIIRCLGLCFSSVVFAQADVGLDLLKPVVSFEKEAHPERWFEMTDQGNQFPLNHLISGLSYDEEDWVTIGRSFFSIPWVAAPSATTARDGLGPLFNANTCTSCHSARNFGTMVDQNGYVNRSLVFKLDHVSEPYEFGKDARPMRLDPVYGGQIAINGNSGVAAEAKVHVHFEPVEVTLGDGTRVVLQKPIPSLSDLSYGPLDPGTRISLRMAPMLAGLGLIEGIDPQAIIANADPDDLNKDGISGRVNWTIHPYSHEKKVGRFGLKAQYADLLVQVADAASHDMGLTNRFFPKEGCSPAQVACQNAPVGRPSPEGLLDLPDLRLQGIGYYVARLKAPKPLPKDQFVQGRQLFRALNCVGCHKENWKTVSGIEFSPYADFLVHDMGDGLADERQEFTATGREWRTAALWGLGVKLRGGLNLLHDGRASDVIQAILWHDGEAKNAKEAFKALPKEQRDQLIEFLENL